MKISLNWLKKYVDIKIPDDELVRVIGARLVEVEGVIDESHKYDKIFVVKVKSAERIEGTHLSLCRIDAGEAASGLKNVEVGEDGLVQVVCGAPNVREGMFAVWIAPGAVVPASVHEDAPFVIGKRKMLGKYESYGMLAGADELDFSTEHKAIAEIDPELVKPGDSFAGVFGLDDKILEIENKSLSHRPDCFGLIGFAREVAGILGEKFMEPEISAVEIPDGELLKVAIDDERICPRYTAVVMEKHGELKKKYLTWMDTVLSKSGMRPVEPIVDVTNYLMLLTGQPLHAFDYDKFVTVGGTGTPEINIRLARAGESLTLIDGREVELNQNDIVVASGNVPVALAGAMGGESTAIDENTKKIIIEAATFCLYNLRKTQMSHGIFSEAITRFTKGQPAYQTLAVAGQCAKMLEGGFRALAMADEYPHPDETNPVVISADDINELLGTRYTFSEIEKTLRNVGFDISCGCGKEGKCSCEEIMVKAPAWRTDIAIKEDVIEEVGRLNGYDNIEPVLPKHDTASPNEMLGLKKRIRDTMKGFGANEVLTYSFVSERLLEKAGLDAANSYKIINSISPDLQYVRQTIVPSLLEKAYLNQKIPYDKFALYEINKVYQKAEWGLNDEGVPAEKTRMGFVVAERKGTGTPYYKAKFFVEKLLAEFNIIPEFLPLKRSGAPARPFEPKRAAEIVVNGECIGVVGEFRAKVRQSFKLAEYLAGFEIDIEDILRLETGKKIRGRFELKDKQDITVTTNKTYAEVVSDVRQQYPDAVITPVSIYQPEDKDEVNITLHLEFY